MSYTFPPRLNVGRFVLHFVEMWIAMLIPWGVVLVAADQQPWLAQASTAGAPCPTRARAPAAVGHGAAACPQPHADERLLAPVEAGYRVGHARARALC